MFLSKQEATLAKNQSQIKELRDDKIKFILETLKSYDIITQELIRQSGDKYNSYELNISNDGPILKRTTVKVSLPQKNDRPDFDEDEQIKTFKTFLAKNYTPPIELIELRRHISSLLMYYVYLSGRQQSISFVDLQLDNVLIKVISDATARMAAVFFKEKSNTRTALSTKSKQTKSKHDAKIVRDEYVTLLNKSRKPLTFMSKNKIAALIIDNLKLDFSHRKVIGIIEKYHQEKGTPPPWK